MTKKQIKGKLFFSIIIFLTSLFSVFSACVDEPDYVKITSGGTTQSDLDLSQIIYINPDLNNSPLRVEFYYINTQDNCLGDGSVIYHIISTGPSKDADSITTTLLSDGNYQTKATFSFNDDVYLPDSFSSKIRTKTSLNTNYVDSFFNIKSDSNRPLQTISLSPQRSYNLYKSGETISFSYSVSDSQSKLKTVRIGGDSTKLFVFDSQNTSFQYEFESTLTNSKTFTFTATDNIGNVDEEEINVIVDSTAPSVSLKEKHYYFDSISKMSLELIIEDDSFQYFTDVKDAPQISMDFSSLQSGTGNIDGICQRSTNTSFICEWTDIKVGLSETQTVELPLSVADYAGNSAEITLNEEIYVDNQPPQITDFYLENELGVRNTFSSNDDSLTLYLKFTEDSKLTQMLLKKDKLQLLTPDTSEIDNGVITWNLGNSVSIYNNIEQDNIEFEIILLDEYNNRASRKLNLTLDNIRPTVDSIEVVETNCLGNTGICDGVYSSNEKINFKLLITDENLIYNGDSFIFADFSLIDRRDGMNNTRATCSPYSSSSPNTLECTFNNIILTNGYLKENVEFFIRDSANNVILNLTPVIIYNISNEGPSAFIDNQTLQAPPINRNRIMVRDVNAWFEGTLQKRENYEDIEIVNYQLKECNESGLNPIGIISYSLYPESIVINTPDVENVEEFAIKFRLRHHNNINDLNEKTINCQISVRKRDNNTIYPDELVNYNLKFSFYDLPRDNLLKAHAQKILGQFDDVETLEDTFGGLYDIYETMDKVCNFVGSLNTIMSSVNSIWIPVSWFLHGNPYTKPAGLAGDNALFPADGTISEMLNGEDSYIKKMCDLVTCRTFSYAEEVGETLNEWNNFGGMMDSICVDDGSSDSSNYNYKENSEANSD